MKKLFPILLILLIACGKTDQKPMSFAAMLAVNNPYTLIIKQLQGDCATPDTLYSTHVISAKGKGWFSSGATISDNVTSNVHKYVKPTTPVPPPPVDTTKPKPPPPPVDTTKPKPPVDTVIVTPPPISSRQNLIFESTFEKVTDWTVFNLPVDKGTAWTNAQTCCALNSLTAAPIARSGSKAAGFTLRKSDPLVSGSLRSEITGPEESTFGTTRWYAFSIYLPAGFTPDNTALLVAQWHSSSFNTVPPMKLILEKGGWSIVNTSTGNGNSVGDDYHGIGAFATGVWTDFVIKILWSNTSGQLQVWKNGTSVFNSTNIKTSYTGGTYFKTGIYGYGWGAGQGSANPPPYVVYIDEWREGNENAVYGDMKPGN